MAPTSRSFEDAKGLGDGGEAAAARLLARHGKKLALTTSAPLVGVTVKVDEGRSGGRSGEEVDGVRIRYERAPKSSQVYGDLVLHFAGGLRKNVEVKTEQYALHGLANASGARRTRNLAFETHDLIRPRAYETLWTTGAVGENGLLPHPHRAIAFAAPTPPAWFERPGGHMKSRADWLLHHFEASGALVVVSLARVRRALREGDYDASPWFATCTRRPGSQARCRTKGDGDIRYYTVGKALEVRSLVRQGRAVLLL